MAQRRWRPMLFLFPAPRVAAFISWIRTTTARVALFLFSLALLLTGGAAVVRAATPTPAATPSEPHFEVSAPSVVIVGSPFNITVTAKMFDNVFTGYTGTVHFTTTSTGFGTQLPDDSTLTNGVGTFSVRSAAPEIRRSRRQTRSTLP
jgi:hypothetical protein